MNSIDFPALMQMLTTVGAVGVAAIAGVWKISEIKTYIVKAIGDVDKKIAILSTTLKEREKDITKIEGANELLRKDNQDLSSRVKILENNATAVWSTLISLFPDKIPKRPTDP